MVAAEQLHDEISERLTKGQELLDRSVTTEDGYNSLRESYYTWTEYNEALLRRSFDTSGPAQEYRGVSIAFGGVKSLATRLKEKKEDISRDMRRLRSLQERLPLFVLHPDATTGTPPPPDPSVVGEDIFIVHGHDNEVKQTVARLVAQLTGREPVILHEQPDRGRTIIEKFEEHATSAACAIVLLTADDTGGANGADQRSRARQNVVLELGFFLGKLGRGRVVILYENDVELPSDLSGILYIALDPAGAWRTIMARELRAAGVEIDLTALIGR